MLCLCLLGLCLLGRRRPGLLRLLLRLGLLDLLLLCLLLLLLGRSQPGLGRRLLRRLLRRLALGYEGGDLSRVLAELGLLLCFELCRLLLRLGCGVDLLLGVRLLRLELGSLGIQASPVRMQRSQSSREVTFGQRVVLLLDPELVLVVGKERVLGRHAVIIHVGIDRSLPQYGHVPVDRGFVRRDLLLGGGDLSADLAQVNLGSVVLLARGVDLRIGRIDLLL